VLSVRGSCCSKLEAASRSATSEAMRSQEALQATRDEAECWQQLARGSAVRIQAVEAELQSTVSMKDGYRTRLEDAILTIERLKQEVQEERRYAADSAQHLKEVNMAGKAKQAQQWQQKQQQQGQSRDVADNMDAVASALSDELAEARQHVHELTAALLAEQSEGSLLRCQLRELRGEPRLSICSVARRASNTTAAVTTARTCEGKEASMLYGMSSKDGSQLAGASGEGAKLQAVRRELRNKAGGQPLTDMTCAWQRAQVLEDGITCAFAALSPPGSPRQTDRSHARGTSGLLEDLENTPVLQSTQSDDIFLNGELLLDQDMLSHSNRLSLSDASRATNSPEGSPAGSLRLVTT